MSKIVKGVNDLATTDPNIAKEWNYNKNMDITPFEVVRGSAKRVWWICDKGHEWQTVIYARTKGQTKCPYCCNQKILSGYNDLQTNNPKLVREWDYDKNGNLKPSEVSPNTRKKVWWKCNKGHEWKASISDRQRGDGCPYCSGHTVLPGYNDLNTNNPNLAKEWNYNKNGSLTPEKVTNNSGKKVWWICDKGHEWQAGINDRQRGDGCPYCSGHKVLKGFNDLFTTNPELKKQWDYNRNKNVDPTSLSKGSSKKVWWICNNGHSYQQIINSKSKGIGCPICDGKLIQSGCNDLKTKNPKLAIEWNYEKNKELTPDMVAPNSNKKVWWICDKGHEWQAVISSRNNNSNCPICGNKKLLKGYNDVATTNHQILLDWDYIKNDEIDPANCLATDKTMCWWKCHLCGFEYKKSIYNKVRSPRCPNCKSEK